jgi:hypothetical protein
MFTGRAMCLGRNYQTNFARSGATIVRHPCSASEFWPRRSRHLFYWRLVFAAIFLLEAHFKPSSHDSRQRIEPASATKFADPEWAFSRHLFIDRSAPGEV